MSVKQIDKKNDSIDIKIIELMVDGRNNKQISSQLSIPLSTIQRRVRALLVSGIITPRVYLDYEKLGFKTGLLHIYLKDGEIDEIAKKVYEVDGITSFEIHIGNSDILANVVYKEGKELLNIIAAIKKLEGVERIVWSERIYQSPSKETRMEQNLLN
jgi:Lrp/AsnC family transcriptional regulator, regulator for asnA, asnC and gidA